MRMEFVAVSQWLYDALMLNGVRPEKLTLSRQGVDPQFVTDLIKCGGERKPTHGISKTFRLLYVGRWHPVKGIDVLVRAVRSLPVGIPLELVIHGVGDGPEERAYEISIRRMVQDDRRIRFGPTLPRSQLAAAFTEANALAVPSMWLETGPLVVLEAKAAGLYVLGFTSRRNCRLINDNVCGELIEAGNITAWAAAIATAVERHSNGALRLAPQLVRSMSAAAEEMAGLYRSLQTRST